jgi:hypothetical protein
MGIACIARMISDGNTGARTGVHMQILVEHDLEPRSLTEAKRASSISLSRKGLLEVTRRISFFNSSMQSHEPKLPIMCRTA